MVYVGGRDCPPCTLWENTYKAQWLASPEFRQGDMGRDRVAQAPEAYEERYWPGELKAGARQIPRKSGTPRFLIVTDGKIVFNEFGADHGRAMRPTSRNVLG